MKKITALFLVILSVLCIFTACQKKEKEDLSDDFDSIKVIDFETTRAEEPTTEIKQNKNYKVRVPASLLSGDAGGNLQKYADTYGYDIKEHKDGTVTMKMDGMTYSLMLTKIGLDTMVVLGEIVDSGNYPYVVKLGDYNKDFSYILMLVNDNKYKQLGKKPSYEELAFIIGQMGLYYQQFTTEEENICKVVIAGSKSGKVLYKEVFTD